MNRMTRNRTTLIATSLAGVFGMLAFAASAQSVSAGVQAQADVAQVDPTQQVDINAQADANAQTSVDGQQPGRKANPGCLKETGTNIRARDPKTGKPVCQGPGRSYTKEDINRTGQTDLADALRRLDPSVR